MSHDFGKVELRVKTGDIERAIERVAGDCSMVIIGATETGLLSRLVGGALVLDIVDDVECSVLLAERARTRSVTERIFGN